MDWNPPVYIDTNSPGQVYMPMVTPKLGVAATHTCITTAKNQGSASKSLPSSWSPVSDCFVGFFLH